MNTENISSATSRSDDGAQASSLASPDHSTGRNFQQIRNWLAAQTFVTLLLILLIVNPYFATQFRGLVDGVGIVLYLIIGLMIGLMASRRQRVKEPQQKDAETIRQQLYALFNQVPLPISVLRGPDHRFVFVNSLTQQAMGKREVLGKPIREALPEYVSQGILDFVDQVYATGKPLTVRELRAETMHYADGAPVPVERYFNVVYQPLSVEQGVVDGIMIFNVDITEQVLASKQKERLMVEREQERDHLREVLAREQELRQIAERATQQLQTTLEVLPVGVTIADASGHVFQRNATTFQLWGEQAPEAVSIADYQHYQGAWADTGKPLAANEWPLARAITTGEVSYGEEIDILTFNGQKKTLLHFASPIRDEQGVIIGGVTAGLDITQRKQLERALRLAEQEALGRARDLEAIFEAIADPVFIIDLQTGPQRMNRAARELLALPESVRTGQLNAHPRFFELYDERGNYLPKEAWPLTPVFEGTRLYGSTAVDVVMRTHDGRKLDLSVTGAPLHGEDGTVQAAVMACRDVTERRRLEFRLRQEEQRTRESLQALLVLAESLVSVPMTGEGGSEAMVTAMEDVTQRLVGLIRSVLNCKRVSITVLDPYTQELRSLAVVGLPAEQEKQWHERRPGFYLSDRAMEPSIEAQLSTGNVVVIDMQEAPFAGQANPYGIKAMLMAPMRIGTRLIGILSLDHGGEEWVFSDGEEMLAKAVAELAALILERERLLEERAESQANVLALQEANYLKDEFIGIAGHELRTPLTTVKASVQLARRQIARLLKLEAGLSPEVEALIVTMQTLLERAERQVGMQNRLVNDLLDVSRIETGRLELHPELGDLVALIHEVVEDQQALTPERHILFDQSVLGEVLVLVDADRLRQVMTNYLSNALKYSAVEQSVIVRIVLLETQVRVEVEDSGPGLTATQQQRIWERFYRVPGVEVRSGSGVGLGLGLHISRMIIERHGGYVGVRSIKGQGSTFWLVLARAE
jgi:signal transduction histidine kinase/PAS domain-containing protein